VWGRGNPKSSTGRLDVFVRLLTEDGQAFDTVPEGYHGPLYLEITPQSFHVQVRAGDTLVQLRLGRGDASVPASEVRARRRELVPDLRGSQLALPIGGFAPVARPSPHDASLLLSIDLRGQPERPVGYLARRHQPPIDLHARRLAVEQYWTPIFAPADGLVLEPGEFYIFATWEALSIPPDLCAELVAFDATKGELRTHYAGFIDSGFGWSAQGGSGARLVLEIRTHDVPFLLEHGQPLFRVEFMRNEARPDVLYGETGSNYQGQALKLAKQFGE
jgi:dCTP deaminase